MNKKTACITGFSGQDGRFLAQYLLNQDYKVYGMIRRSSSMNLDFIKDMNLQAVELIYGDLSDSYSLSNIISKIKPVEFYNLAAQSHVGVSFNQPEYTVDVTGAGVFRLLESIKDNSPKTKFLQASSSEMFGDADSPQNENTNFNPRSPYAVAKVLAHKAINLYRDSYGLFACSSIAFNHESIFRPVEFVTRKVTDYIGRFVNNPHNTPPLRLGNIDAYRDWSSATDIVRGMHLIMQQDIPDDYVLGSGRAVSVREFVVMAFAAASIEIEWIGSGIDEYAVIKDTNYIVVKIDKDLYRPCEVPFLKADCSKIQKIGWTPLMNLEELVNLMVKHDIQRYANDYTTYKTNYSKTT